MDTFTPVRAPQNPKKIFIVLLLVIIVGLGVKFLFPGRSTQLSIPDKDISFTDKTASTSTFSNKLIPHVLPQDIPKGFTLEQLSPYFHEIKLNQVSPGSKFRDGKIILTSESGVGSSSINVTGWTIKSNRGNQVIPQAVEVYDPSGSALETDIYLGYGDVLKIFTNKNAVGKNFRLNKCLGYLENKVSSTPSVPLTCPPIYKDPLELVTFTGKCQNYVTNLESCSIPNLKSKQIPQDDTACRELLSKVSWQSCFDQYKDDPAFLGEEVRVWNGKKFLDELHDLVLLLDAGGLLVDEYIY